MYIFYVSTIYVTNRILLVYRKLYKKFALVCICFNVLVKNKYQIRLQMFYGI